MIQGNPYVLETKAVVEQNHPGCTLILTIMQLN